MGRSLRRRRRQLLRDALERLAADDARKAEIVKLRCFAGLSRKRMIGAITGREVDERMVGSAAAALLAVERGARIVRVHDVAATRDALAMYEALRPYEKAPKKPTAKPKSPWDDE